MRGEAGSSEALLAELLRTGHGAAGARAFLSERELDESRLVGLLHLAVPASFLEAVASTPPWSERPRVLGAVCLNPKAPRALAQRLLPVLYWRDLADLATSPRVEGGVRARAEALLRERVAELRLGEKITLARLATPALLRLLLQEADSKIVEAALQNPRLTESDLVGLVQSGLATPALLEAVGLSSRWRSSYAVRLALVLQPRTPAGLALGQLTSLVESDLRRIAGHPGLRPVVREAARRVAAEGRRR
ncbi:MAG TPA: hypothetical protein VFM88_08105 [Vicinamibacteria bacterium]|nr:hypothetical protein [Vicinamibacteria bacterium]